jgi:hypothetical protein
MNTDTNGTLIYVVLVAIAAVIAHSLVRRFWLSCGAVAVVCSLVNLGHEVVVHDFQIRPVDALYWLPMDFVYAPSLDFQSPASSVSRSP